MSEAIQAALDARYQSVTIALRQRLIGVVLRVFGGGSYRDADADAFVEQVLPVVLGAQQQMGALTDAYLAAMVADMFGGAAAAGGVQIPDQVRGVPAEDVYRRPFVAVWTALSQGKPLTEAVRQGETRLVSIAGTDLQLARTEATRQVLGRDGRVQFYRRVLRGSYNCAMCVIASTQRYRKERLMPIHPGCDCGTRPLPPGSDPGQVIEPDLLEAAHDAVAKGTGQADRGGRLPDYRDIIIDRQHGELGPLMALRRHDFTASEDLRGR